VSTDPFEHYEKLIKKLEEQRDTLVDACDRLIDCLSDWIEVSDRYEDVADDRAAIETANAAIRAAQPKKESEVLAHTPEPWYGHFLGEIAELDCDSDLATGITTASESEFEQNGGRGDLIAWVPHDRNEKANIALITAAPELLAVIRMAINYANDTKSRFAVYFNGDDAEAYDTLLAAADAAIDKAEGKVK